ncbi:MAG: preprotein translocase subunit SecA [Planctomycetota bacterium]
MVFQSLSRATAKVFGSRNDRLIKGYNKRVVLINALEDDTRRLTDAELKAKTQLFREQFEGGARVDDLLPEVFAVAREVMDRYVGIRNIFNPEHEFDASQLSGTAKAQYEKCVEAMESVEPAEVKGGEPAPPWLQIEVPVELYDAVRGLYPESRPPFRARPFDVQLIGGMVIGEGKIAEMRTGEGKTIVAPLACYFAAVQNLSCHVVTVNDYLVQRDRDWVFPFYYGLGLTVGAIHPYHMQPPPEKAQAYECDVVYGTNAEFGFDYLRDNMKMSTGEQVQKNRDFCVIDEVDSILIDEARTPLIISGPARQDQRNYALADQLARHLMDVHRPWAEADKKCTAVELQIKGLEGDIKNARDKSGVAGMKAEVKTLSVQLDELLDVRDQYVQYYETEPQKKAAHLTHEGVAEAQKKAGIGSFYVGNNIDMPHLLENALKAHVIYQKDKDYVVEGGEVVIVDENTGRKMVGRQWSDGLHQAVEAKEKVKIKEETQTLATVTIQNFFKLYKRLGGMTGTAITEGTEFMEIYSLDVVAIPTNKPIARVDRNDLIFMSEKDKWDAILDEIKRVHDLGRPVLVGTTSVEKSESLSRALTRKHGIKHEVLNAKQHERESGIVEDAGRLGAVMIATNMAGRGTDIKLRPITREDLIHHWKQRDLLPSHAELSMSDDEIVALSYRHQAMRELGIKKKEAEGLSDEELKLRLLRQWCVVDAFIGDKKAEAMDLDEAMEALDGLADYQRHRLQVWHNAEAMGGLHIVGTERHESRRIDNQLRGRAGRQGDQGSSRFFLSLEDPLMRMFAGDRTKAILSRLGMKEGDAIEHGMVSRSVERAQKKVEERNYQIRKNLLEYDEVMEYQRSDFYGLRQRVIEGEDIADLIFGYIDDAVDDAAAEYLDSGYAQTQAAEWVRQNLEASIEPGRLALDYFEELEDQVRKAASLEMQSVVDMTLGEYMSDDLTPEEWDVRGLSSWAMSRFQVNLSQNKLRGSNPQEVRTQLLEAAEALVAKKELDELKIFSDELYGQKAFVGWCQQKFGMELKPEDYKDTEPGEAAEQVLGKAREQYRRRERTYGVEFVMDLFGQLAQQDQTAALEQLYGWCKQRFGVEWTPDEFGQHFAGKDVGTELLHMTDEWLDDGGELHKLAQEQGAKLGSDYQGFHRFLAERFGVEVAPDEFETIEDHAAFIEEKGRAFFRAELTRLERFVLLQILDQMWKDHLYAMDQMKDSIGLRGYAEKDPKIEYKREGANLFVEMQRNVRDRVTELIFRARLTPQVQVQSRYGDQEKQQATGPDEASAGGGVPQRDPAMAAAASGQSGAGDGGRAPRTPQSRKARRAAASRDRKSDGGGGGSSKPQYRKRKR